jgi:hypothetical protein
MFKIQEEQLSDSMRFFGCEYRLLLRFDDGAFLSAVVTVSKKKICKRGFRKKLKRKLIRRAKNHWRYRGKNNQ